MMRTMAAAILLCLAACSPSTPKDPRAAAGTWPPRDYAEFTARPPMSVGAELDDAWTMAIEAERWSYTIGVAIVAVGGTPQAKAPVAEPNADHVDRAANALDVGGTRLNQLQKLTCATPPIATAEDCTAYQAPPWLVAREKTIPSKDANQANLQWFEANAYKFVQPACAIAIKRTGDERYCVAE